MINVACITAAGVVRRKREEELSYVHTEELYYKVKLRRYYHFKPMVWPLYVEHNEYTNVVSMRTITVEAMTFAAAQSFSVKASKCTNGIDTYIKDNLDSLTAKPEWKAIDERVIADYCANVKKYYYIDIDPTKVNYTTEYYWEVH